MRGVNRTLTGAVTASGGAAVVAGRAGGNAGNVLVTGSDGSVATAGTLSTAAITASTGAAAGTGAGGTPGSIRLEGSGVTTGALTTTGGANGGGGGLTVNASGAVNVGVVPLRAAPPTPAPRERTPATSTCSARA